MEELKGMTPKELREELLYCMTTLDGTTEAEALKTIAYLDDSEVRQSLKIYYA